MTDAPHIPADADLEAAVLGAVLLSDRALKPLVIEEHLQSETFYRERHRLVYDAMLALAGRGAGIDVQTVIAELQRRGHLDQAGGRGAIDALPAASPSAANVREHARRLVELAELRQIATAGHELVAGVETEDRDLIAMAERRLSQRGRGETSTRTGEQLRDEAWAYLETDQADAAFPFPWDALNEAMGGLRRQDTTFVGAWTNMGKSPFVDQILDHVATSAGAAAHLYANEGNRQQRTLRNVARRADVNLTRLERKRLRDDEKLRVAETLRDPLPFGYTDCSGWSAGDIARHMRWHRYDVVAVDLLHNIEHERVNELDAIVLALTQAAVQADCHLLLVGQFNEERAKSEELPRPVLRDIRGSGMIKNLCANVLFVHRDQDVDDDGLVRLEPGAIAYFQKVRYGQRAGVNLKFTGSRQRFDLAPATLASAA